MTNRIVISAKFVAGQVLLVVGTLVLLEALMWMLYPLEEGAATQITQNLPGLKKQTTYSQIGGGIRSVSQTGLKKPKDSQRILCLGASTTDQAAQATEDTWCAILERRLRENQSLRASRFHTLSYGKGGYRAIDNAAWLAREFERINPDVVITLLGINDLTWSGGPGYKTRDVESYIRKANKSQKNVLRRCVEFSQLCRLSSRLRAQISLAAGLKSKTMVAWSSKHLPKLRDDYKKLPYLDAPERSPDPISEFQAALKWLLRFSREHGADVVVLGQPVLWNGSMGPDVYDALWFSVATPDGPVRASGSWLFSEITRYNNVQKAEASSVGFAYVDLNKSMPKTLEYFFDDCHFTDKGSALVAELVLPAVTEVLVRRSRNAQISGRGSVDAKD